MDKPAPKSRKNNKPIHWDTAGVEVLLRYVNKHKGDRPKLAFDQSRALTDLRSKLDSAFSDEDFKRLRETSVRDKLTHIFRRCKKEKYHAIKDFWVHGLNTLDLQKVKAEYAGISLDFVDSDSETDTESEVEATPAPKKTTKRKRSAQTANPLLTIKFKKPKTEKSATKMATSKARNSQEFDQEIEDDLLRSRDDDGMEIPESDEEDGYDGGYEDEGSSSSDSDQAGNHVTPTSGLVLQNTNQSFNMATPQMTMNVPADNSLTIPQSMEQAITALRKKIHIAVTNYLLGQKIPQNQPAILDLNMVFSREMKSMLALLAGTNARDWDNTKAVMEKLFASDKKMSLNITIQSLVGAAIQRWCLEPFSGTRWWDKHAMETDVQILLRRSVPTRDFETFRLRAIRHYIQNNFVPAAPRLASQQARLFDQQVMCLLPDRPASSLTTGESFVGPPINPQAADPAVLIKGPVFYEIPATPSEPRSEANIDESRGPIITSDSQESWIEDLSDIFHDALVFRAQMEMPYDQATLSEVEWLFDFPRFQDKVDGASANTRVIAGMFPKIYAIEKMKRFLPQGGYAPLKGERTGVTLAKVHAVDITQ